MAPAGGVGKFAYCDLCRINHDQGPRHRFFSSHRRALSAALSRHRSKLADIRFFLRNPVPLLPEHEAVCRHWCIFCALDLREDGSCIACSNIIYHLASADHLKNVKSFLWRHGSTMDQVIFFTVSETELTKWEKDCEALRNGAHSLAEGPTGTSFGPSYDIQNETNAYILDDNTNFAVQYFNSNISFNVTPLQNPTNKSLCSTSSKYCGILSSSDAPSSSASNSDLVDESSRLGAYNVPSQSRHSFNGAATLNAMQRSGYGMEGENNGLKATVHTVAVPPWFDEGSAANFAHELLPQNSNCTTDSKKKASKLNPKRVGAAWAERRRAEMELEKKGIIAVDQSSADWLPNFGRVWQSGTRKESKRAFLKESKRSNGNVTHSDPLVEIKPYIRKRMRFVTTEELNSQVETDT